MGIPKIIHQTYKGKNIPPVYRDFQKRIQETHPDWSYRFYDDDDCRNMIKVHLRSFLPIFNSYPENIMRVDAFRIIAIYLFGGFYLDMDMLILKKLDPLCIYNCVFAEEKTLSEQQARELDHAYRLRIANYMFGSVSRHPFLLGILVEMAKNSKRTISTHHDLLETTGPGLITTTFHQAKFKYKDVTILRNQDRKCPRPHCQGVSCHFGNYAMHFHFGTWRWKEAPSEKIKSQKSTPLLRSLTEGVTRDLITKRLSINPDRRLYTLKTYNENKHDGLTTVYHQVKEIGIIKTSTRNIAFKKVVVCGIPFLYLHRISSANLNVIYTTFETTRLPDFWVYSINNHYRYCIVPHQHVKAVFENSNVKIPIKIIPQGFNRYKRFPRKVISKKMFRIGFLGVPVQRKNLYKLFLACKNLLSRIPSLRLSIHVSKFYDWASGETFNEIRNSSFVEWSECILSDDQVSSWYSKLSCYVFPTSGEGWSFTPRESMYLGIPTIISDIPVHQELVASNFYNIIPTEGLEDAKFDNNIYGMWYKINIKDIEASILEVFHNFEKYQEMALKGSRWIEDRWTQEQTRHEILSYMNSI